MNVENLVEDAPKMQAQSAYDGKSPEMGTDTYEGLNRMKEIIFHGGTSIKYWM